MENREKGKSGHSGIAPLWMPVFPDQATLPANSSRIGLSI